MGSFQEKNNALLVYYLDDELEEFLRIDFSRLQAIIDDIHFRNRNLEFTDVDLQKLEIELFQTLGDTECIFIRFNSNEKFVYDFVEFTYSDKVLKASFTLSKKFYDLSDISFSRNLVINSVL